MKTKRNVGVWASAGAMIAAVLSSACCWLPLLLIGLGGSAAGVAGVFEAYRLYLLAATGLLLAAGYYLVFFRKPRCEPGSACAVPKPRLARFQRALLLAATAVVLVFALFPNYAGLLIGGGAPRATRPSGESRVYAIEGMSCEACAATLGRSLSAVPGVARAEVSYGEKSARVFFEEKAAAPGDGAIREAIEEAGYHGRRVAN